MSQTPSMRLVAVVGVGARRGRRLTCAALGSAAMLAGAGVAVTASHGETRRIVSRETAGASADVLFGVVDRDEAGAPELLAAAKRVVVTTWGAADVEGQVDEVLSRLFDDHGFPGDAVSLVFHEPSLDAKTVKSLARIDRLPFGGRVYCAGAFSRAYHEAAAGGRVPQVVVGEEPALAMFAELWMELRL